MKGGQRNGDVPVLSPHWGAAMPALRRRAEGLVPAFGRLKGAAPKARISISSTAPAF